MDARPRAVAATQAAFPVARRLVLVFPGFEALPVEAFARRFIREAGRTAPVYGMVIAMPDKAEATAIADGVTAAAFSADASGDGWRTVSEIVHYAIDDHSYSRRSDIARLLTGLGALSDFVVTGTFFRFVRTSWRYGLFFAYPLLITLVLLAAALLVGLLPTRWFGWPALFVSVPAGLLVFLAGLRVASRRAYLLLMMDDWAFARDIARGRKPEITARIAAVAADAVARIHRSDADEIVFAAHSFGAFTAMFALSAALEASVLGGRRPGLMTVGSSLLKVALHPGAKALRAATATVVRAGVPWLDVQSLTDPINFYKSDPARDLGIAGGTPPNTIRVRFRSQLSPQSYRAIRRDLFRTHRQYVYAVERRHHYSFHAMLCGPEPFAEVTARGGLRDTWADSGAASP
ncbi:MAG: hypothetical protein KF723_18725 [Rhizobiaceae bacterium]|nr:hypothetical protein [Rhizobiaceae bacterium]